MIIKLASRMKPKQADRAMFEDLSGDKAIPLLKRSAFPNNPANNSNGTAAIVV